MRLKAEWELAHRAVPEAPKPTPREVFLARLAACEKDASKWVLRQLVAADTPIQAVLAAQGQLYGLPSPCQYDLLGREVAFLMLREMGYSADEAHQILGIDRFYYRRTGTNSRRLVADLGPTTRNLSGRLGMETELLSWLLTPDGGYARVYVLWGCYSGQGPDRANEFAYECLVRQLSLPRSAYFKFGEVTMRSPGGAVVEHLLLFGYRGDGRWEYVGHFQTEAGIADPDRVRKVYEEVARAHGTGVWDGAWLEATFGVRPKPLPEGAENWPSDQAAIQRMVDLVGRAEKSG